MVKEIKTLPKIEKEIAELKAVDRDDLKPAKITKIKKRLEFLRFCIRYLETNPPIEFMNKEEIRLEKRLSVIEGGFMAFKASFMGSDKDARREYEKIMSTKHTRNQLRAVRFILGS